MKISKATAFETREGRVELYSNSYVNENDQICQLLDVMAINNAGRDMLVCSIEYNSDSGLSLKVFGPTGIEPVFEMPISFSDISPKKFREVTLR